MGFKEWAEKNKAGGPAQLAKKEERVQKRADLKADWAAGKDKRKAERDPLVQKAKLEARAQEQSEKARAKAQKKGVNVDGALVVAYTFTDGAEQFLVVFPDRIEHVNRGKPGLLVTKGAGTETIPVSRVSSAECRNEGIACRLEVYTSGNSISFKTDQITGPVLRQTILDLVARPAAAPSAAPAAPDVTDQLRKLGELHSAGILTDAEFSAKKTELLDRL
jgi:Short C-terminal domain